MPNHMTTQNAQATSDAGDTYGMCSMSDAQLGYGNEYVQSQMASQAPQAMPGMGNQAMIDRMKAANAPPDRNGAEVSGGAGGILNTLSGLTGAAGLDGLSALTGLLGGGLSTGKSASGSDPFSTAGDAVNTSAALASLFGKKGLSDMLGPAGNVLGIFNGIVGATDGEKETGERIESGVDAASNGFSLAGLLGGASLTGEGGLAAMELSGVLGSGAAGLLASGGALLAAGLGGWKTGGAISDAGDSEWARQSNLGGYDDDGNKRTLGDFWADTAVDINHGADRLGDDANDWFDGTGESWGDSIDDTLGGGGGAVEWGMDVAGDSVNFGLDLAGDVGGGVTAGVMGTAGGIADGATAAFNYLNPF